MSEDAAKKLLQVAVRKSTKALRNATEDLIVFVQDTKEDIAASGSALSQQEQMNVSIREDLLRVAMDRAKAVYLEQLQQYEEKYGTEWK